MPRPKVIFLDAVGTLFGVKGSVGEVYADMAQRFGVEVSAKLVDRAFVESFPAVPPPVFLGITPQEIPKCEYEWWYVVAQRTFQQLGNIDQFADFSTFFAELYTHFASAAPWFVYPDVRPALQNWRQLGIELGVVSNFDSRLYSVLQALELAEFFSSITISTEVGVAKPDAQIFNVGLQKHGCLPKEAWHIGDSWKEDYQGARAAGLFATWLQRSD